MNLPTAQEIFDKVVTHLRGMKGQSKLPGGGCAYRGEGGNMCAVGCLISDEEYHPHMEGKSVLGGRFYDFPATAKFEQHSDLLSSLQEVHDDMFNWGREGLGQNAESIFRRIANNHSLTYTPRAEAA